MVGKVNTSTSKNLYSSFSRGNIRAPAKVVRHSAGGNHRRLANSVDVYARLVFGNPGQSFQSHLTFAMMAAIKTAKGGHTKY